MVNWEGFGGAAVFRLHTKEQWDEHDRAGRVPARAGANVTFFHGPFCCVHCGTFSVVNYCYLCEWAGPPR